MTELRSEQDTFGTRHVPVGVYWGIHTARAIENFDVSGIPIGRHAPLVAALGVVKQAAARANRDLGLLAPDVASAIDRACADVRAGSLDDQFVVDVMQGGAGTSTNMNANEVIANRASELLGVPMGVYRTVHPIDHVNKSQSTNDVYPSAVKLALVNAIDGLAAALNGLSNELEAKASAFSTIVKVGRTQLQDAVPMTVGQEFRAWASILEAEQQRLADAQAALLEVNLGGTAIGTGIATAPGYQASVIEHLSVLSDLEVKGSNDLVAATSDTASFVQISAAMKSIAVKISKICNDMRLLASGPQAGLGELRLPTRQAGSSIMPGKVNPVVPEMVNQVAFAVIGNDVTVTMAAEAGQLQLNAFEPVIAHRLLEGLEWLTHAVQSLTELCVKGIQVDLVSISASSARSVGVVTALVPHIGYELAAQIAHTALHGGGEVRELVLATGTVDGLFLDELLRPETLTAGVDPYTSTKEPNRALD